MAPQLRSHRTSLISTPKMQLRHYAVAEVVGLALGFALSVCGIKRAAGSRAASAVRLADVGRPLLRFSLDVVFRRRW